jgi:hypothetical protein
MKDFYAKWHNELPTSVCLKAIHKKLHKAIEKCEDGDDYFAELDLIRQMIEDYLSEHKHPIQRR